MSTPLFFSISLTFVLFQEIISEDRANFVQNPNQYLIHPNRL